ncbi:MAG: helix-turn-helix domain-containing protein, partial [Candidatus Latescibacterota bacterium]
NSKEQPEPTGRSKRAMYKRKSPSPESDFCSISDAARYTGVSWQVVNNWIASGHLLAYEMPALSSKRMIRIRKKDLETFIQNQRKVVK